MRRSQIPCSLLKEDKSGTENSGENTRFPKVQKSSQTLNPDKVPDLKWEYRVTEVAQPTKIDEKDEHLLTQVEKIPDFQKFRRAVKP